MTPLLLHPAAARTATDEELVAAVRAGTRGAFEAVHARYEQPLLRYARRLLHGSHHDAEECVQDAFVRGLRFLREHHDREIALQTWLYAIVRNACTDRLRNAAARPRRHHGDGLALVPDRGADPSAALERREALREVVAGVLALPERQRRALVAHELEGRSHGEVARSLGVSEGASKALVHRARAGLQAA